MQLSDAPGTRDPWVAKEKHVPFTAFLRAADPIRGKRQSVRRYFEKNSEIIENQLNSFCDGTTPVTFDLSKPVAYTPQFGNRPARFTINGHACKQETFTKTPHGEQQVDHNNAYTTQHEHGMGAGNRSNEIPDSELNALALSLVAALEAATGRPVIKMQLAGYIYGDHGTTIPHAI